MSSRLGLRNGGHRIGARENQGDGAAALPVVEEDRTGRAGDGGISSRSRSISSASFHSMRPFSDGLTLAQLPSSKARRAAATVRSTSALSPSGTLAITAPVAGLYTSKVLPEAAPTILPSISIFDERPRKFV